jgi:hypothetical protein
VIRGGSIPSAPINGQAAANQTKAAAKVRHQELARAIGSDNTLSFPGLYLTQWGSNNHCDQFDHSESNRQHRERHRIVIEPMLILSIHDTSPFSSNFDDIRTQCWIAPLRVAIYSFLAARRAQ